VFDDRGIYVSAILDMGNDLHAYTTPRHRRQGFVVNAMRNVVLPSLSASGRTMQYVTYNSPAGAALIDRLGGRTVGSREGEIDLARFVILNWALKLKEEGILGEDLAFSEHDKAQVRDQPQSVMNFFGPVSNPQIQQDVREGVQIVSARELDQDAVRSP
jgi:hypothetical protein